MGAPRPGREVVALRGGLGNQLFQFSYAQYLGRGGMPVNFDLSCARHGRPDIFDIPLIGAQARRMAIPVTHLMPSPAGRLTALGTLSRKAMRPGRIVLDHSPQGTEPAGHGEPAWWFGYWQRLSYAEAVIPALRTALDLVPPARDAVRGRPAVARLHVRRGDYAGNAMELPADWYRRAVDLVYASGSPAIETEVVTNDATWCEKNLDLGRRFRVRPTATPIEDLRTLARSDYLVISRSTFSWWAAAVSDAAVIAPDPWFPHLSGEAGGDLIPRTWLSCPA
jgi:hypothetical protein